jgi:hypothetical protein
LNSDEIYLLEDFCKRIEQFNDMPIVYGGDRNLIMENIDKKGGSSVLTHKQIGNIYVNSWTEMT